MLNIHKNKSACKSWKGYVPYSTSLIVIFLKTQNSYSLVFFHYLYLILDLLILPTYSARAWKTMKKRERTRLNTLNCAQRFKTMKILRISNDFSVFLSISSFELWRLRIQWTIWKTLWIWVWIQKCSHLSKDCPYKGNGFRMW